ncbi:MAG TPA: DNA mismatch repair endonuclease MutL [Acidobacteriota bacterium]|nr:DNA mismatch repair endonuclease MutL [Acidobacteriota bacterium]
MPQFSERKAGHFIRPLPERLINKIAAGEVVERPASVVKELVENSLDAGADRIEISIEKAGVKLIKISDTGCGIPEDQIEIAFSRHATSKISGFDDLDSISSYGFRGEALPSIASVSRLRMVSRSRDADVGAEVVYEGGVLHSRQPVPAAPGTTVEVADLFFNTPARRKFLKAESTELRHVSRTAMALAIGRHDVAFTYRVNGRQVFAEPAGQELAQRVQSLLAPGKQFVPVKGQTGPVSIEGYLGLPDLAQSNRTGQYVFINGRAIQSATLAHAFVAGYGELMPRGSFPVGALMLTVDPKSVDVNVHPAKTEVRLSHEREIHDALYRLIREALRHDGVIPGVRSTVARQRSAGGAERPGGAADTAPEPSNRIPGVRELAAASQAFLSDLYRPPEDRLQEPSEIVQVDTRTGEIVQSSGRGPAEVVPPTDEAARSPEPLRLIGRFSDLYLIIQRHDELLIVDQHTAHERVLFEQTLGQIEAQGVVAQHLLLPVQIDLSPEQLALFDEAEDLFNRSGFQVARFGGRTVRIEAVPSVMSGKSPEKSVRKILDDIGSLKRAGYDLRKAMAQSIACRSAVMAGDRLTDAEAVALVSSLLACENAFSCPHGRPTMLRMSRADLDRQFGRG